jgi:hypothetical protein
VQKLINVMTGRFCPRLYNGNTRGYIESPAKQINGSHEQNIFDGCAVSIRRLEEALPVISPTAMIDGFKLLEICVRQPERPGVAPL